MSCPHHQSATTDIRPDLPTAPPRMARLPISPSGYPVPFFVAWIDGVPDFRVADAAKVRRCHTGSLCWLCGERLGSFKTFVIGPMCAINRVSSEPPSHRECAQYAAKACPFLTRPRAARREDGLPEDGIESAGIAIKRNPGVALVWTTKHYAARPTENGVLFDVGEPTSIEWFAEGREATRDEVIESIESGLQTLRSMAEEDGPAAVRELERRFESAMQFLPSH